jgi:hypothetical protein
VELENAASRMLATGIAGIIVPETQIALTFRSASESRYAAKMLIDLIDNDAQT